MANPRTTPLDPDLEKALRATARRLQQASQDQDDLIVKARQQGVSYHTIGRAIGMSHVGVRKAVQRIAAGRPAVRRQA